MRFWLSCNGVLLALVGADDFRPGFVRFAQREIVQRPVSVQHDAVVGTAFVIQFSLVGQQRAGFLAEPNLGLLRVVIHLLLRGVERLVAVLVLAVGAQRSALLQAPDDGVLVVGIFVGRLGGLGHGVGQIAALPVLDDLVLLLISFAAGRQQTGHRREQKRLKAAIIDRIFSGVFNGKFSYGCAGLRRIAPLSMPVSSRISAVEVFGIDLRDFDIADFHLFAAQRFLRVRVNQFLAKRIHIERVAHGHAAAFAAVNGDFLVAPDREL